MMILIITMIQLILDIHTKSVFVISKPLGQSISCIIVDYGRLYLLPQVYLDKVYPVLL